MGFGGGTSDFGTGGIAGALVGIGGGDGGGGGRGTAGGASTGAATGYCCCIYYICAFALSLSFGMGGRAT